MVLNCLQGCGVRMVSWAFKNFNGGMLSHRQEPPRSNSRRALQFSANALPPDSFEKQPLVSETVNPKDSLGRPLLHRLVLERNIPEVEKLLSQPGLDINATDQDGLTALFWAAKEGNLEIVKKFLELPTIEVNIKGKYDRTALHLASMNGHDSVVEALISHPKIDINVKDEEGKTGLIWAHSMKHKLIVQKLSKHPALDIQYHFLWASKSSNEAMVHHLLSRPQLDINAKYEEGETALIWAVKRAYLNILHQLIKCPDLDLTVKDDKGKTALTWAVSQPKERVLLKLLAHPSQPATNLLNYPFLWASRWGKEARVHQLLSNPDLDINSKDDLGRTALILASKGGHLNIVHQLMAHPHLDINAKDQEGKTALSWALSQGHQKIAIQLLEHPDIPFSKNDTLLQKLFHLALQAGNQKVAESLLAQGVDINAKDEAGKTPLHLAAGTPHTSLVQWLLGKGVSLDAQDQEGNTPLHLAANSAVETRETMMSLLLKAGANPNIPNAKGVTPIEEQVLKMAFWEADWLEKQGAPHSAFSKALYPWLKKLLAFQEPHLKRVKWDDQDPVFNQFVQAVPYLLSTEPKLFVRILNNIERLYDRFPELRGYHPNESELMLLAKNLRWKEKENTHPEINALTKALTSITRFIDLRLKLTDETLKAWGDIGFLSHAFRFWRYDTVGGAQSLLTTFGFQPAPKSRPFNEVFGRGFLYEHPASGALVEFRRGYLLVSEKGLGTLIIRNSSTAFGRDLLKHPAYFLPQSLSREEILSLDPRTLSENANVLHRDLYDPSFQRLDEATKVVSPSSDAGHRLWTLTQRILSVKEDYRKFKLDTQAFTPEGEFQGHLSPGFLKLVQVLNKFKVQGMPLPDLAFVHPEFPISQPYSYGDDASGQAVHRLKLTPSVLKELNDFVSGHWSEQKYPDSTWIEFIKKAGVENRGELVMLAPEI
jgi:ankyrin repeat protein